MIVAESIGFAGTHSITNILSEVPGIDVSHGSQDFGNKAPLGEGAQTIPEFLSSMSEARNLGQTPIAVHTLFPPQELKPACDAAGCDYWLLVRDPEAQIESCYAWITRCVLTGNAGHFMQVLKVSLNDLNRTGIPANLSNALYYFAVNHVLSYNFVALGLGTPTRKMEVLLSDEAAFRDAFAIPADVEIAHFAGDAVHEYSHRAKQEDDTLAQPERELIRERYALNFGGRGYTLSDMRLMLGY